MKRTPFFRLVTITLLMRANAAALHSARWMPPSLRAAARLRMSRSLPLLSAGTRGSSRKVNNSSQCLNSRLQIRRQSRLLAVAVQQQIVEAVVDASGGPRSKAACGSSRSRSLPNWMASCNKVMSG